MEILVSLAVLNLIVTIINVILISVVVEALL